MDLRSPRLQADWHVLLLNGHMLLSCWEHFNLPVEAGVIAILPVISHLLRGPVMYTVLSAQVLLLNTHREEVCSQRSVIHTCCFVMQVAALCIQESRCKAVCVVITPLISLALDQVSLHQILLDLFNYDDT